MDPIRQSVAVVDDASSTIEKIQAAWQAYNETVAAGVAPAEALDAAFAGVIATQEGNPHNNHISNLTLTSRSDTVPRKVQPPCLQCDRPARARGLCHRHYQQLRAQEKGGWKEVKRGRTPAIPKNNLP